MGTNTSTRNPAKMCSLCGTPLTKTLFEARSYPIAKCTTCDLVSGVKCFSRLTTFISPVHAARLFFDVSSR